MVGRILKDAKVDEEDIERWICVGIFRLGKTLYLSYMEVIFPVVMKGVANVIEYEEVKFCM